MTQNDRSTRNRITDIRAITFGSARRSGKAASSTTRRRRNAVMLMTLLPGLVWASELPTGGSIVSGSGNIARNDNTLTITQNSNTLITNWQDFSIGAGNTVNFVQPGSSAVALNRVLGNEASQIYGTLNANGQVFLINPNGVLFGQGASVNVGGLVASTLSISDSDFLAGNHVFTGKGKNSTNASVINQGTIKADGGVVALLGGTVSNQGVIQANLGSVALAAGNKVTLDFAGDGLLNVTVDESALNALAENHQLIKADGGSVLLTAKATDALLQTVVNNTGVIEAHTLAEREGKIILLGGFEGGTVKVAGTLDASAPLSPSPSPAGGEGSHATDGTDTSGTPTPLADANGSTPSPLAGEGRGEGVGASTTSNGGFIETSGAHVQIADSATVTTKAANGQNGKWLIDPTDFTVAASGGDMTGAALSNALQNGSVEIQSTLGSSGTAGDVNIKDVVNWSENTLTLNAQHDINIYNTMNASGTAGLFFKYGQADAGGSYNIYAPVNLASTSSFRTQSGSAGALTDWTIITSLGAAGSSTGTDLQGISGNLGGNYVLGADIDASSTATWNGGAGFTPVGFRPNDSSSDGFTGTLDGLGHVIDGLTINNPTPPSQFNYVGLFGYATNAHIANTGLTNVSISGGASSAVGGFIGASYADTSISNSYVTGSLTGGSIAGGLIGYDFVPRGAVSLDHVWSTGTVTATVIPATSVTLGGVAGGLIGAGGLSITNSYSTADVRGSNYVGGLAGYSFKGLMDNSYFVGSIGAIDPSRSIYALGALVGQFSGINGNNSEIKNSHWNTDTAGSVGVGVNTYGSPVQASVTGLTTAQMRNAANWTGFNFVTTPSQSGWVLLDGVMPLLASEWSSTIRNAHQLQLMGLDLAASYVLANDIDASASNGAAGDVWYSGSFSPIGTAASKFTGSFDGQGHVIDGLTINRGAQDNVGLFGYAGDGAVFANVGLRNADITGRAFVGTLLGQGGNTDAVAIDNAWSSGTVTSTSTSQTQGAIGGLVGGMSGTIDNSHSSATVTGDNRVGGLVGQMSVDSNASKIQQISNSYATGDVSATFGYGGGLVGRNFARIANSYATGDVSGGTVLGGLVGYGSIATYWNNQQDPNTKDSYLNVYASGNVTGTGNDVGGLFGLTQGLLGVHNAFATGNVVGAKNVGGLIGRFSDGGSSSQQASLWSVYTQGGTVTGQDNVGGLIGSSGWVHVTNSYSASGLLTATDSNAKLGGMIGGNNTALSANIFIFDNGVWNIETTGTDFAVGDNAWGSFFINAPSGTQYLASGHTVGATTAQMMTVEPYAVSGFNNGQGGLVGYSIVTAANAAGNDYSQLLYSNNIYFLYEGQTYPLLRAFLQKVTVNATPDFDGTTTSLTNIGSATLTGVPNFDHIYGTALFIQGDTLTLTSTQTDSYTATSNASVSGLWSDQFGYEIGYAPSARIISTPGSAAGDIQLPDSITWESGTLVIDTGGALITGGSGVNTTIISGDAFRLANGNWWQNNSTLAGFSVNDFQFAGGTFLRATRGSGDEGDAYRLADVYGLQGMASTALLDKHFTLVNDVDASGTAGWNGGLGFVPIGDSSDHFTGVLDGLGFAIHGLTINRPAEDYVGLFGFLRGEVRNLGLVDARVTGQHRVGSLAGYSGGGSLSQVFAQNVDVTATGDYVGGLVGVTAHGGGGIVQAWATGTVSGQQNFVGGLAGYAHSGSHIRQSWADVAVSGVNQVGGLLGYNKGTHMVDVQAYGDVTASGLYIGGLVGVLADAGTITNATASGRVSSSEHFVGGLVGYTYADSLIRNGLAEGEVSGLHRVGGLAGYNRGSLERVQAHGSVTATGTYIGGLVGVNAGHISQAWATGDVSTTTHYAGGLAGYTHVGSTISDARADGAVSGISRVGGLAGQHGGSLANGLSTGAVTGSYYTGGLVGHDGGGSVTTSFWDTQTTGQASSAGGTGLDSSLLQQIDTYTGWSISTGTEASSFWWIENGEDHPMLRAFLSPL